MNAAARFRLMWVIAMTATLGLPLEAHSAPGNAPEAEPAKADGASESEIALRVVPTHLTINRSISFDENGEPTNQTDQLNARLRCTYDGEPPLLAYRDLTWESAVTSAGETLDIPANARRGHTQPIRRDRRQTGPPSFDLHLNLPAPQRPARHLEELRGTVTLRVAEGDERVIRLAPLSDYLGKRFRVVDMGDATMSLRGVPGAGGRTGQIELTHPSDLQPLIQEVAFTTAMGGELSAQRRGASTRNNATTQRFAIEPPDGAALVIKLYRGAREIDVPVVVRDVPLPDVEPAAPRFDLAIATQPLDAPFPIAPGPDAPAAVPADPDALPVILVE
ncbi:MAG: hypothetical protein AAFX76_09935 [Planctomycetota bacterium]